MKFTIRKLSLYEILNDVKPIARDGVVHIVGGESRCEPSLRFISYNKHATIIRTIQTKAFNYGVMSIKIDHALTISENKLDLFLFTLKYNEGDEYITVDAGGSRVIIKRVIDVRPPKALPLCCERFMPLYSIDCLEISKKSQDYLEMVIETLDNPSVAMNEKFVKVYSRDTEFYAPRVAAEHID